MIAEAKTENLMASTWTPASIVRRAFNAGPRRKSAREFDDLEEAVLAAYVSFMDLRKAMKKVGLAVSDVRAAFVLMTAVYSGPPYNGGVVTLLGVPDALRGLPDLLREAERHAKGGGMAPLGMVFWQRDKAPRAKKNKAVWVQLWRQIEPRVQRAADAASTLFEELDGRVPEDGLSDAFEEC